MPDETTRHNTGGQRPAERQQGTTNWCIRNDKHKPLSVLANALIGVREIWPTALAYDEMCARRC